MVLDSSDVGYLLCCGCLLCLMVGLFVLLVFALVGWMDLGKFVVDFGMGLWF